MFCERRRKNLINQPTNQPINKPVISNCKVYCWGYRVLIETCLAECIDILSIFHFSAHYNINMRFRLRHLFFILSTSIFQLLSRTFCMKKQAADEKQGLREELCLASFGRNLLKVKNSSSSQANAHDMTCIFL